MPWALRCSPACLASPCSDCFSPRSSTSRCGGSSSGEPTVPATRNFCRRLPAMFKPTSFLLVSALLAGCAVGPNYQPPRPTVAATFQSAQENLFSDAAPEANWWANFRDPALDALIVDALKRNHSLRIAQAALAEARAARRHALWAFAPTGGANGSVQRGQPSETEAARLSPPLIETWSTGFDAAWEIDVFGRTRRRAEAATAELGMAD